jgi:NodT family efflux transporter outer membrane factor (OMF) lipoprotein
MNAMSCIGRVAANARSTQSKVAAGPSKSIRRISRVLHGAAVLAILSLVTGCTGFQQYVKNGFKVGPNYCPPRACVEPSWIDAADLRSEPNPAVLKCWWTVFHDPKLDELINCAYRQNLSLREAGYRILQARASRAIVAGEIFPQRQAATGSVTRNAASAAGHTGAMPGRFSDSWNFGFGLNWELDFWGRFRRAILAADANLDASVYAYDDVLVTLLGDVATNYVVVRATQERINLLRENVEIQKGILQFIDNRLKVGFRQTELDHDQSLSTLRQTEAAIPQLEISLREAENNICILLGRPPTDLTEMLSTGKIPVTPPEVVVGIPADLVRRRPDVRRAERLAAAQAQQIGIAEADLYPAISINGNFGYSAQEFADLFRGKALYGSVGPSFQWNLLNYGRIVNNVRLQDARFQELVVAYQSTVLQASREVENGLVEFLRAQQRSRLLDESVGASRKAVDIVVQQYKVGTTDYNRYALIEQNLVTQQDTAAQAKAQIAQGLIAVYRALGGGWEIRCDGGESVAWQMPPESQETPAVQKPEVLDAPQPQGKAEKE